MPRFPVRLFPVQGSDSTNPPATARYRWRPGGNRLTAHTHAHECLCAYGNVWEAPFCGGMGHQGRFPDEPQPCPATHNPVCPGYYANRPPNPRRPTRLAAALRESGTSIVIRRPRRRGAAAAGFADSSRMGWVEGGPSGGDGDVGSFAWPIRPCVPPFTTGYVPGTARIDRRHPRSKTTPSRRRPSRKRNGRS